VPGTDGAAWREVEHADMSPIPSCSRRQHKRSPRSLLVLIPAIAGGAYLVWRWSRCDQTPDAADPAVKDGMRFEVHAVDMASPSSQVTP
jgi:hypothetical protein